MMGGSQRLERFVGRAVVNKNDFERGRATLKDRH